MGKKKPKQQLPPPYLDRLSSSQIHEDRKHQRYRRLLIQPVSIPSLDHTGIKTAFSQSGRNTFIKPDGSACSELRSLIRSEVKSLPRLETHDMRLRDIAEGRSVHGFHEPYDLNELSRQSIESNFGEEEPSMSIPYSHSTGGLSSVQSQGYSHNSKYTSDSNNPMGGSKKRKGKNGYRRARRGNDQLENQPKSMTKTKQSVSLPSVQSRPSTLDSEKKNRKGKKLQREWTMPPNHRKQIDLGVSAAWSLGVGALLTSPSRREQPCFQCLLSHKFGTAGVARQHKHFDYMVAKYGNMQDLGDGGGYDHFGGEGFVVDS